MDNPTKSYIVYGATIQHLEIRVEATSQQEATDKATSIPLSDWDMGDFEFQLGFTEEA
jgi:hypothetical protein